MWLQNLLVSLAIGLAYSDRVNIPESHPRFIREASEGVHSLGYHVVYGDEDYTVINEVVQNMEMQALKRKERLSEMIKPLPSESVKCLMSVDRYCSKEMGQMKSVLIQAVQDDCKNCSDKEKEEAGKVIASMMAHDPSAWKMFLTRCAILREKDDDKKQRIKREQPIKLKAIGEPEEVEPSQSRKVMPGVKIRVTRNRAVRIS